MHSQVTIVVTALILDYKDHPSSTAGWSTIPIYKALGLQYGVVHGEHKDLPCFSFALNIRTPRAVLNGLLYLGVSISQRDFLYIILSRTFCPRSMEHGEDDDVVGVDAVSWSGETRHSRSIIVAL